ncbi:MAG: hypothetical protein J5636_07200 [Clostridiales bacterium]|nr:hypothetical protein [Clostridiales bacterium]
MVKESANKDAVKAVADVKPVEAAKKEEVKAAPKAEAKKAPAKKAAAKKAPAAKKAAAPKAAAKKAPAKKAVAKKAPAAKKLGKIIFEIEGQQIDFKAIEKKAAKLGGDVYVVAAEKKIYDTNGNSVELF